jgi:hypothetical protein
MVDHFAMQNAKEGNGLAGRFPPHGYFRDCLGGNKGIKSKIGLADK